MLAALIVGAKISQLPPPLTCLSKRLRVDAAAGTTIMNTSRFVDRAATRNIFVVFRTLMAYFLQRATTKNKYRHKTSHMKSQALILEETRDGPSMDGASISDTRTDSTEEPRLREPGIHGVGWSFGALKEQRAHSLQVNSVQRSFW